MKKNKKKIFRGKNFGKFAVESVNINFFKNMINKTKIPEKIYSYNIYNSNKKTFQNDIKKVEKGFIYYKKHYLIKNIMKGDNFGIENLYTKNKKFIFNKKKEFYFTKEKNFDFEKKKKFFMKYSIIADSCDVVFFIIKKNQLIKLPEEIKFLINLGIEKFINQIDLLNEDDYKKIKHYYKWKRIKKKLLN